MMTTDSCSIETQVLNVSEIKPDLKHPAVFDRFDSLKPGESFRLINDHDPKPLYYQMIAERGNTFSWTYLEKGPEQWIVLVKKNEAVEKTVGEIAAEDIGKAEVLKNYGLDFCCGGKKPLREACMEKGIDVVEVENALQNYQPASVYTNDYNKWKPDFLADYIYNQHHLYYYEQAPVIQELLDKVVAHHGKEHPYLETLSALYKTLSQELNTHFAREEKVLFPFIKKFVNESRAGVSSMDLFELSMPIQMMESDHEAAGDLLAQIKMVTSNYTPPADACNSFRFLYKKLSELEDDLHQHIHLENNILFPKALALEKEIHKKESCSVGDSCKIG